MRYRTVMEHLHMKARHLDATALDFAPHIVRGQSSAPAWAPAGYPNELPTYKSRIAAVQGQLGKDGLDEMVMIKPERVRYAFHACRATAQAASN